MSETATFETKGDVAIVTVDRPDALNALNRATLDELSARVDEVIESQARALVITGAGDAAFVAGADIASMRDMGPDRARALSRAGHELLDRLESAPIPAIAAVNGFALGGGLELALACDIRVASEEAEFGTPETSLGVVPGFGGTQRISRIAGLAAGLDLVLTGRQIDAEEAQRLGLVTHVVDDGQARSRALELAETIASNGPVAVEAAKRTVRSGFEAPLATGDEMETEAFAACFATDDQEEGMDAFLEKREPEFTGGC